MQETKIQELWMFEAMLWLSIPETVEWGENRAEPRAQGVQHLTEGRPNREEQSGKIGILEANRESPNKRMIPGRVQFLRKVK